MLPPRMASTSLQPSSIIEARASRKIFSIGYSWVRPLPPKICNASLATSKAVCVEVILLAIEPAPAGVAADRL